MTAPILVVAIPDSVHSLCWLRMISAGSARPAILLPSTAHRPLAELRQIPSIACAADLVRLGPGEIGLWAGEPGTEGPPDDMPVPIGFGDRGKLVRAATIVRAIQSLRPALLHSLELQAAGYACLRAIELLGPAAPPWLVSSWGSDFYLYRKLASHRPVLKAVARRMDGFLCECAREIELIRSLGFTGSIHQVMPATGGADFTRMPPLSSFVPTSARRRIIVKGYHGWSGRGQHILSALHLAAAQLRGYRISIVLANPAVALAASTLAEADGLDIAAEPWDPSHEVALRRIAEARMVVGLGISDGIGTTLLEAMALGAFPIAGCTSCAAEWLDAGTDGMVVDPHDVAALAEAIRIAATDDGLVDAAAPRNRRAVERRWNISINGPAALTVYAALIGGKA